MSRLRIFNSGKVSELLLDAKDKDVSELRKYYIDEPHNTYSDDELVDTRIEVGDAPLLIADETESFNNAVKVFEYLKLENELQATDRRLWCYLCHAVFCDYLAEKHKNVNDDSLRDAIITHWFNDSVGNKRSLLRNDIASLWWGIKLTYAPYEWDEDIFNDLRVKDDPYYYSRILMSKSDILHSLVERNFGSNRKLLIAILDVLSERESRQIRTFYRIVLKRVNQVLGGKKIAAFSYSEIHRIVQKICEDMESKS